MMKHIKLFEYFEDSNYCCPECGGCETISREEWNKEDHSGNSIFSEEHWKCGEWEQKCKDCGECYDTPDI